MIPTADTQLYTVDTPGGSPPLLFLSGGFGTVKNWNRSSSASRAGTARSDSTCGRAGSPVRQPTTPCKQRSTTSDASSRRPASNYRSWSDGPTAPRSRCATRHTVAAQVGGLVLIDGAYPIAMLDEAGKEKVRAQFRRLGWIMRILAALGRSAWMSPAESADVVIEMDAVNGELEARLRGVGMPDGLRRRHRRGHGCYRGGDAHGAGRRRRGRGEQPARSVFATTPHKHTQILNKAPDTVVAAIEDVIHQSSVTPGLSGAETATFRSVRIGYAEWRERRRRTRRAVRATWASTGASECGGSPASLRISSATDATGLLTGDDMIEHVVVAQFAQQRLLVLEPLHIRPSLLREPPGMTPPKLICGNVQQHRVEAVLTQLLRLLDVQ